MHLQSSKSVRHSWRRCRTQHRLDRAERLPSRVTARELAEERDRLDQALGGAMQAMHELIGIVKASRCALLLASERGVVVQQIGSAAVDLGAEVGEGSVWTEAVAGTNAVGTALWRGAPTTVQGPDHHLEVLQPFACVAVPLHDAQEHVIGVLDLTTWATHEPDVPFLRHTLEGLAAEVHLQLFARAHAQHVVLALPGAPGARALVAIGADGALVGVSRPARQLLAPRSQVRTPTTALGALVQERLGTVGVELSDLAGAPSGTILQPSSLPSWSRRAPASRRARRPLPRDLAGDNPALQRHTSALERIVDRGLPILLQRETGTGKGAMAAAIHAASARHGHPLVAVNCASLPESLLDSELFGYAPGTFTGGLREGKAGKIEAAHRGTLFLDEIGDMPLAMQGRLLRVLAEGEVTRLGAIEPVSVDLHVMSATHQDLHHAVAAGTFREDLYYRLAGARFELPPLRERGDFDALVHNLLAKERVDGRVPTLHPDALRCLRGYRWPGNIRQLQQVLALAAALATDPVITVADLPEEVVATAPPAEAPRAGLVAARAASERAVLQQALEAASWNVSAVARSLGIGRTTVHRKMRALGIRRPR